MTHLLYKRFDEITADDIQELVDERIDETAQLDYKEALANGSAGTANLAKYVTAMANAAGGIIVFGIEEEIDDNGEKTGRPVQSPSGVASSEGDAETLRSAWENAARNGIEPPIVGLAFRKLHLPTIGAYVILARVPSSAAAPHMLTSARKAFYLRRGNENTAMTIHDLREAFGTSEQRLGRIVDMFKRNHELHRYENTGGGWLAFQIAPMRAPFSSERANLEHAANDGTIEGLSLTPNRPMNSTRRFTANGLMIDNYSNRQPANMATMLHRDGAIHSYRGAILNDPRSSHPTLHQDWLLTFVAALTRSAAFFQHMEIAPPFVAQCSLHQVTNSSLQTEAAYERRSSRATASEVFGEPFVLYEYATWDTACAALRPTMDLFWNLYGRPRCFLYDGAGTIPVPGHFELR
ncbi:MAG: ATP-binding protein [Myxococcota bacterium]